jgi:predicted nicotinamide N-methyase
MIRVSALLLSLMAWEFLHPTLSFNLAKPSRKAITSIFISSACLLTTPVPPVTADLGPLGNVGAALQAISSNSDSLFCNLDNFNIKEGQSSCQQLDSVVRYKGGKLLTIRQDWGGSASTGAAVWNGANMATWYLENTIGANNVQDKSVLELGAGVGFTSLVANAMGARDVVITDGNEDVLKLANANIDLNCDDNSKNRIRTARLQWNTDDEQQLLTSALTGRPWDYIFASDVTYKRAAWGDLMACISHLSGPNTKTVLSMEPRNVGEVEGIVEQAEKQGLVVMEQGLPVDKEKTMCGMMCARLFVLTKKAVSL